VAKSLAVNDFAGSFATGSAVRQSYSEARAAAEKALALAPELGEAHSVLAAVLDVGFADYSDAEIEHRRALALSLGNAQVLRTSAFFFAAMGRAEIAITNAQRSVDLDPLNVLAHSLLGRVLYYARRYGDAIDAYNRALSLDPHATEIRPGQGLAYWALGQYEAARAACATPPVEWEGNTCLAVVYHKLQRQSDADAALAAIMTSQGDAEAIQYAEIYAQWGNIPKALEWLETAYRTHDPGLVGLKTEPMLDPLREEPRFKAIERQLKFLP